MAGIGAPWMFGATDADRYRAGAPYSRQDQNLIDLARIRGLSQASAVQEHLDQIAHAAEYDPRQNPELHPPEAPETPPSLFEQLMGMASGANSKSQLRAATAPQRAAIKALQENLGMIGAQTAQSQADIGSWFGQLGD